MGRIKDGSDITEGSEGKEGKEGSEFSRYMYHPTDLAFPKKTFQDVGDVSSAVEFMGPNSRNNFQIFNF